MKTDCTFCDYLELGRGKTKKLRVAEMNERTIQLGVSWAPDISFTMDEDQSSE